MSLNTDEALMLQPVVARLEDFDRNSGTLLERVLFNNRLVVILACLVATVALGYEATKLRLNAGFEKMIPHSHPYIQNYRANKESLRGLGNALRVVVENTDGDIYSHEYLSVLRDINDEIFLIPGVDRAWMKSLWMPAVRWTTVTEQGFQGGPVMANTYDGSPQAIEQLRENIARAGIVGTLVAGDFKSSMIVVPLLDRDPQTGQELDYQRFCDQLEKIRAKFAAKAPGTRVHIVGFAKLAGDLMDGLQWFVVFFLAAIAIDALMRQWYIRCWRSTGLMVACSLVSVLWLLGILPMLGYELDPFSVLIPFLVFSIGMSHGSQKMNGIMQDIGRGTHRVVAARYTFRRLFLAGVTALLADAVGFAVLMLIRIQVIQDLAVAASLGVAILILTNLMLLPILLSYTGVNPEAAVRSLAAEAAERDHKKKSAAWAFLDLFTHRKWATAAVASAAVLAVVGLVGREYLKVGDLDPGAPELRPGSRYNRDNAYITANYGLSSDQFAVMVKTPQDGAAKYETLVEADRLAWALQQVPGVQAVFGLPDSVRQLIAGTYEGSPKWFTLSPNQEVLNVGYQESVNTNPGLVNGEGTLMPISAYLSDHKAETLERVVKAAEEFSRSHGSDDRQFLLAAGTAGIEAATNIVVEEATGDMLYLIYGAVILLCFITFRSWRAVLVAVVPLAVTSVLCEALMAALGIGVKVATLPVIALGVGIGVDYALYILSVVLAHLRSGKTLSEAYYATLAFTGRVVVLTGLTLAFGVATWAFSPIKFQADMGILLVFMFVWNMLGALILIPALSYFLLKPSPLQASAVRPAAVATEG